VTTVAPSDTGESRFAGLIFSLAAVWVAATGFGLFSVALGAVAGAAGFIAAVVYHARSWIIGWLRGHDLLRDPATWGVLLIAAAPFFIGRVGPSFRGISLDDVPLVVGTLLVAISVLRSQGWRRLFHPVAIPLAAFAIWSAFAALINGDATGAIQSLGRWGLVALAVAALARFAERPAGTRLIVAALLFFGLVQAAFGLWAYVVDWMVESDVRLYAIGLEPWRPWEPLVNSTSGRITGTLGISSNFFGALMIIPTALAVGLFGGAKTGKARWAYALCAFGTAMALSFSFTRASLVGMLVGFAVLVIATRKIRVLGLVVALVIAALVLTPVATRFGAEHNRFSLFSIAIDVVTDRPFTGAGEYNEGGANLSEDVATITNEQGDVITPHNSFLLAAAETGVPGGLLLLIGAALPGVLALIASFRRRPEQAALAGLAAGMAGYGVQTFSNNLFHIPNVVPFYWLAAAAAAGIVWHLRGERKLAAAQD